MLPITFIVILLCKIFFSKIGSFAFFHSNSFDLFDLIHSLFRILALKKSKLLSEAAFLVPTTMKNLWDH